MVVLSRWFQSAAVLTKNEFHSWSAWQHGNYGGPIIVSYIVTSGGSCDVAMLLLGLSESTRFLLSQKFIGGQCFLKWQTLAVIDLLV